MKMILSVDQNWGIGKEGKLLLRLPGDTRHFRQTTEGNIVVMGRKTFLSLPGGALPNRRNIVLSRSGFTAENVETVKDIPALLALLQDAAEEVYIIGGGEIYRQLLPYTDTIIITKFDVEKEADTFFINLDEAEDWVLAEASSAREEKGVSYRICTYRKNNEAD
ncbi:MAG: dihydrofolate reductase [Christensenellaceae bacterium]